MQGGLVVLLWVSKMIIIRDKELKPDPLKWPMAGLFIAVAFSGLDVMDNTTLTEIGTVGLLILFYYAVVNTVNDLKLVRNLSLVSLISLIVASIYGIYQHYYLNYPRVQGFMFSLAFGNVLAMFSIFTLIYLLWGNLNKKEKKSILFSQLFCF